MQLSARTTLGVAAATFVAIAACTSSTSIVESTPPFVPPIPPSSGGVPAEVPEPTCPADPPKVGERCSSASAFGCRYGPDARDNCADVYTCASGRWALASQGCEPACPATFEEIVPGTPCVDDGAIACSYERGTCACIANADAGAGVDAGDPEGGVLASDASAPWLRAGTWKCAPPPSSPYCPHARPRPGDACVKDVECDYGSCALQRSVIAECSGGRWTSPLRLPCEEP